MGGNTINKSVNKSVDIPKTFSAISNKKHVHGQDLEEKKEIDACIDNYNQLNWDKLRHGATVTFISPNCILTGQYSLAICDSIISRYSFDNMLKKQYFIWEIVVDKIAKDSSFIGYINGPITKYNNNNNKWNICLTEGKRDNRNQFAIAFNNGSRYIDLFGAGRTNKKLKLNYPSKYGDSYVFVVDFIKKCVILYHNKNKVDIIFKNISDYIIPAVSGNGGQYTINIIKDTAIIDQNKKNSNSWSFWRSSIK